LWACGSNTYGQLGDGTTSVRRSPVQILAAGVRAIAAGGRHSLILKTDGSLLACGNNSSGQLGDDTTTGRRTPVENPVTDVAAISAGASHSLMVKADGSLWACGDNADGVLGNGSSTDRRTPIRIVASGVTAAAGGGGHSLVAKTDGSLWSCGNNDFGQRADGTVSQEETPIRVLVNGVTGLAAGLKHTLVVKKDGSLWACGDNGAGQLGDGSTTDRKTPTQVLAVDVASASAGGAHSLIVKTTGALLVCGSNASGQLGTRTRVDRLVPFQLYSSGVARAAAGGAHSLILDRNGSLWACGENSSGQLGDGSTQDRLFAVRIITGDVAAVAAGASHSLIVKTDGSLWACGSNAFGQLGDNSTTSRTRPVQILADGVASVSAGRNHSLIVMDDGSLWGCGDNSSGQLGDGSKAGHLVPTLILAEGVLGAAAGATHSLVARTDGTLWACGENSSGQLGDGTTTDRPAWIEVPAEGVTAVAAGGDHSLALAVPTYTLTYLRRPGGTLSGDTSQTVVHGSDGTPVAAVPNTGYHFTQWNDGSVDNPRTDRGITADLTVRASFELNRYTLTYQAGANGSVEGTTPQTVLHGNDSTAVTAVPDAGFHFSQWSDGSTENPRTDREVAADLTAMASFAPGPYTLTYTAGEHGAIAGPTPQAVTHGGDGAAVTAVPDADHHFVQWSDGSGANPRTDRVVSSDITVTAQFAAGLYTLTYRAGNHGSLTGPSPQRVAHGNDGATVTAVPDSGYHFTQWTDGVTANPRTDTGVATNITVTAQFSVDTGTVTFLAGPHGTLTGSLTQQVPIGDDATPVTAVPDYGYRFVQWDDGSTENPRTVTGVVADRTLTAVFAAANPVAPEGTFLALTETADVGAGRGWWHLTGTYTLDVAGNPLTLNLVHDVAGVLGGTATCTVGAAKATPVTMPITGRVKGANGEILATLALKGTAADKSASVSLALRLAVDAAAAQLAGSMKGSIRQNGTTTRVDSAIDFDLPAAMDGTWQLGFDLDQNGTAVTGTAQLTLANGVDFLYTVSGKLLGSNAVLSLKADPNDAAAASVRLRTTILPQEGGWAQLLLFSGKGLGQSLSW
jgi:alpha-tubulin suppressor-like RCC1 family protein